MYIITDTPPAARVVASAASTEKEWSVALRSKSADELEIVVYDAIGSGLFSDGITSKDVIARLRSMPNAKRITLRINSGGGVLNDAKAMVNLLTERAAAGVEVTAVVDGIAASAASYLLTAATRVQMPANAFQMVHGGRCAIFGTVDALESRAALLRRENGQMAEAYAAASARRGKAKSKDDYLKSFAKGDLYLDADEAIEWGLADEKLEDVKVAACLADLGDLAVPDVVRAAPYVVAAAAAPAQHEPPKTPAQPAPVPSAQDPGTGEGKQPMKMIALATITALLGFSAEQQASAEEKDVLDALNKLKAKADKPPEASVTVSGVKLLGVATEAEATAKITEFQRGMLQLLGTTGKASVAEAIPVVLGWKEGAEQATALTKKVGELSEEARVAKRDGAIEKLSRDGVLPPSRHEWARAQFATAEAVETFCQGMPKGFFGSINEPTQSDAAVALTADEQHICKTLGMSEQQYLEEKKLLRKAG